MRYKDYEGYTKPYIIVHNTGFGVMEDNYVEHEVVAEADTYLEATRIAKQFERENNTTEEIQSSWIPNTYHINVNTNCKDGQILLKEWEKESDKAFQRVKDNPEQYTTHKANGFTYHFQKIPEFDSPKIDFTTTIIGGYDPITGFYSIDKLEP